MQHLIDQNPSLELITLAVLGGCDDLGCQPRLVAQRAGVSGHESGLLFRLGEVADDEACGAGGVGGSGGCSACPRAAAVAVIVGLQ